jgi:hypothetical protein
VKLKWSSLRRLPLLNIPEFLKYILKKMLEDEDEVKKRFIEEQKNQTERKNITHFWTMIFKI